MSDIISGRRLTTLPKTNFSGLDFDNIIQDITQLVLENPDYNNNWNDFLSSNAGRMMVELFAYISDQLATRIDWVVNENFIGTATQDKSIIRLLKLIGYKLSLPIAAEVPVSIIFDRPVGDYEISYYDNTQGSGDLNLFSLSAKGRDGSTSVNFEAIPYDEINRRFLYREGITLQTGNLLGPNLFHQIRFYEGKSIIETIEVNTNDNFLITLKQNPIIENSIDVFLLSGVSGNEEIRLERVESFLSPRAQRIVEDSGEEIPIPYVLNTLENNRVSVEFGSISLLPNQNRRPLAGNRIRIFYRIGGGTNGNIPKKNINTSRRLNINNQNVNVEFINDSAGFKGEEEENIFRAAAFGPLQIRTAQKTVTPDDYDIILNSERSILKAKSYGHSNMPVGVLNLYGTFIKPLEVWNYLVLNKPGWQEIPPSKYNVFEWFEQRLQNRFNEVYSFRGGNFNLSSRNNIAQIIEEQEIIISDTITVLAKNFFRINTTIAFKDNINEKFLNNSDFKMSFTYKEIDDNYFSLTKENNYFNSNFELINNGELKEIETTPYLFQQENAHFVSSLDIANNRDMTDDFNVKIGLDNRDPIEVDLKLVSADQASVTDVEIVSNINTAFTALNDNAVTADQKGSQTLGLNVLDFEVKIEELLPQKKYYFKVNGIEYYIDTEKNVGGITYTQLIEKMNDALSLRFKANFRSNNSLVTITENEENMIFLNKNHILSAVENPTVLNANEQPISIINWINNTVTLADSALSNLDNEEIKVKTFNVAAAATDIEITNLSEEPVGPVWLQNSQRDVSEDLFTVIGASLNAFIPSYGSFGKQKLNINGVINETRGFLSFKAPESHIVTATNDYEFKMSINGLDVNDGLDITVNLLNTDNLATVRTKLITELHGLSYNGGTLNVDVAGDIFIPEIGLYNELRIISNLSGQDSTIEITTPADGVDLTAQLQGKSEVSGEDDAITNLPEGTYSFKLNNYTYSVDILETDTIKGLFDTAGKIGSLLDDHGYTINLIEEEWNDEIEIVFDTADRVDFEDIDFFSGLIIKKLVKDVDWEVLDVVWEDFGTPYGGGDYSHIANYFDVPQPDGDLKSYIYLKSPSRGERTSIIRFTNPTANNITPAVFGLNVVDEDKINYGYKRISLILNEEDFGNFIFESGTLNFRGKTHIDSFYHYLYSSTNVIPIGSYFNTNFSEGDAEYREKALRIFNTVYDEQGEIDYSLSEFNIKATKDRTEKTFLFSIEDDWDLSPGTPAQIISVENPHTFLNTDNYELSINIDNLGYVDIDVTGNLGVGSYTLLEVRNAINTGLRDVYGLLYGNFLFCVIEGNRLIIRSPLKSIDGSVYLRQEKAINTNAIDVMFNIEQEGKFDIFSEYTEEAIDYKEYKIYPTGDYFIFENRTKITGDFVFGEEYITNISPLDMSKIEVGYKVYGVGSILISSYILEKNESENKIKISNVIVGNDFGKEFFVTDNSMEMYKINEESNLPDSDFYIHFINDRRMTEGSFDGRLIINEETGVAVKTPGNVLGSLDEDFYESFLRDKKIVGIDNIFRQPVFKTFTIIGTIHFKSIFSREDVRNRVEDSLRKEFGLENRNFAEPLSRSEVMNIIHSNEGVDYVEINFFGEDSLDPSTNVANTIKPNFNEIVVLSENIISNGRIAKGIGFNYVSSSGV